ncbi:MAG: calcium-binding protein, partial [Synechococcales bacterium]|nr:calcium-binding protein [Synechococcales bacterium]
LNDLDNKVKGFDNSDDVINGQGGNDILWGLSGDDLLRGGTGDDLLVGGAGIDQLDGGEGSDTADLSDIETGVNANLSVGTFSYPNELGVTVTEIIRNIENIIGTQFGDILTGNQAANRLEGGNGDDRLFSGNGNDTLLGGDGDDWLAGGAGIDLLDGGDGFDLALLGDLPSGVRADLNTDQMTYQDATGNIITEIIRNIEGITSGEFNDELIGDAGNNRFDGRGGNDILRGGLGDDYFLGGAGIDFIDGGAGFDTVNLVEDFNFGVSVNLSTGTVIYNAMGSTITETILNIESVIATQFDDEVIGNDADNLIYGLGGNDRLFGGDGNDGLVGGDGIDFMDGGAGFDTANLALINRALVADLNSGTVTYTDAAGTSVTEIILNIEAIIATSFNDTLIGNDGNNRLNGGAGSDRLFGGAGNDDLIGGEGDDILAGGSGSLNYLRGDSGSDIFVLATDGFNQVLDFEPGIDKIGLSGNLTVNQFKIEQGTGVNSSSTWIKLASDNTNLMLLNGVQASALTTAIFLPASSYPSSLLA